MPHGRSLWRSEDAAWVEDRKAQWALAEPLLVRHKSKKALRIVKRYFDKGTLPDWADLNARWRHPEDPTDRHIDLLTLLWLYPTDDKAELTRLRDAYVTGHDRIPADVESGRMMLNDFGVVVPSMNGIVLVDNPSGNPPYLEQRLEFSGNQELLFSLVHADPETQEAGGRPVRRTGVDLPALTLASLWLCIDELTDPGQRMLLQHAGVIEYIRALSHDDSEDDTGRADVAWRPEVYELALYRIHHFDTEREGASARTAFVTAMRRSLDDRPWLPRLAAMWQRVKANKVVVERPWQV